MTLLFSQETQVIDHVIVIVVVVVLVFVDVNVVVIIDVVVVVYVVVVVFVVVILDFVVVVVVDAPLDAVVCGVNFSIQETPGPVFQAISVSVIAREG